MAVMISVPSSHYIGLLLAAALCVTYCTETQNIGNDLQYVVLMTRHGDRTPLEELPANPVRWLSGEGELSPLGMRQLFKVGQSLNTRYQGFLPANFSVQNVFAESTPLDRTLQSAASLLTGLYPPGTGPVDDTADNIEALPHRLQVFPIHQINLQMTNILLGKCKQMCPNVKKSITELWMHSPNAHQLVEEMQPFVDRLASITGFSARINDTGRLYQLHDALLVQSIHGKLDLPISKREIDKLGHILDQAISLEATASPTVVRFCGGPIVSYIQDSIRTHFGDRRKLHYISAHDSALFQTLAALGLVDMHQHNTNQNPPYAAHILFEVFGNTNPSDRKIKVRYQNHQLQLPCQDPNSSDKACSLSTFLEYLSSTATTPEQWEQQCSPNVDAESSYHKRSPGKGSIFLPYPPNSKSSASIHTVNTFATASSSSRVASAMTPPSQDSNEKDRTLLGGPTVTNSHPAGLTSAGQHHWLEWFSLGAGATLILTALAMRLRLIPCPKFLSQWVPAVINCQSQAEYPLDLEDMQGLGGGCDQDGAYYNPQENRVHSQ